MMLAISDHRAAGHGAGQCSMQARRSSSSCKKRELVWELHLADGGHKILDAKGVPIKMGETRVQTVTQLAQLRYQQPPLHRVWLVHSL